MRYVSPTAKIAADANIGYFTVIGDGACIGSNVTIGNNVTIYPGSIIGDNVYIESNAVIGRLPRPAKTSTVKITGDLPPVKVGAGSIIGCGAVLYAGTEVGSSCLIGDRTLVREYCLIGDNVVIGSGSIVENCVTIAKNTKIQSGAYITTYTIIGENCFIAPMVTTLNDNFMGRTEERFKHIKGADIKKGARVGGGSILLPGIKVAEESFIAAGAVVTRDTLPARVYKGVPAKEFRIVPEKELLKEEDS